MSGDDKQSQDQLIPLRPSQRERLMRVAESRLSSSSAVDVQDIILEAVDEYLARIESAPRTGRDRRPERSGALFQFLFGRDAEQAFERLSAGIIAVLENADALLNDASILAKAKRYERAQFLIATAQEEMGKCFILLDMCRVDLSRRQHILRHLCNCFYSHVIKNVYFDLSANTYAGIQTIQEVQYYFRQSAREWWPGSPESGEPDMPHDTYFLREANLYVDVDTYAESWTVPCLPSELSQFDMPFIGNPLEKARDSLGKLRAAHAAELLSPEVLCVYNSAMKSLSIDQRTSEQELLDTYDRAARYIEEQLRLDSELFNNSALRSWPMYWIRR